MKLVKEILYEKFTEESDPIEDMSIGISQYIEKIKRDIIDQHNKANRYGGYGRSSAKEIQRITSPLNISKYVARYYFTYGVDESLGVIQYFISNKLIEKNRPFLIYAALKRGKSIKDRTRFIKGLVDLGIKIKPVDIDLSMGLKNDEMTRFLIESAMQQKKKPEFIQTMLNNALKRAMGAHKVNMILWLFKHGANPAYNKYQTLQWALVNDEKELVKVVLQHINNDPEYK